MCSNALIQEHHAEYLYAEQSFWHVKILKMPLEIPHLIAVTMGQNLVCNLATMCKRQKEEARLILL